MIRKRKTAPVGSWGGSKFNSSNSKIEPINFSGPKNPAATPANDLISVSEACDRSGIFGRLVNSKWGQPPGSKLDRHEAFTSDECKNYFAAAEYDPDRIKSALASGSIGWKIGNRQCAPTSVPLRSRKWQC